MEPADRSIEVEKPVLSPAALATHVRDQTSRGRTMLLQIDIDKAMLPKVMPSDVLEVVGATALDLGPPAIVLYQKSDGIAARRVVKRVHRRGQDCFRLRDEAGREEPAVPFSRILGEIIAVHRNGHRIPLRRSARTAAEHERALERFLHRALMHVEGFHFWVDSVKRRFRPQPAEESERTPPPA